MLKVFETQLHTISLERFGHAFLKACLIGGSTRHNKFHDFSQQIFGTEIIHCLDTNKTSSHKLYLELYKLTGIHTEFLTWYI